MEEFKEKIGRDLPAIWNEFFEMLQSNINKVKLMTDIIVLKLTNEKNLIEVIGKDKELSRLVYKAEGYFLLLESTNCDRVKEILSGYGYFFEV